mmetsp:Transcript_40010/g.66374  ORF Transcript_40010/g.66374 Transcript_40010/m.66374 type:complete len:83 (+) Transcript_40010:324-572(+)
MGYEWRRWRRALLPLKWPSKCCLVHEAMESEHKALGIVWASLAMLLKLHSFWQVKQPHGVPVQYSIVMAPHTYIEIDWLPRF